ncbi:hypothetical protein AVEN_264774-1 [Araneus ventricosus]|uniref:Uncharacterized protein n=1 Tax=Araneus ventricosus TaxID=182803 RepID=A0A4Y2HQV1_ARAVE|nr:hypothetical protein AVEN_264774-1 [Araneus ventricosus]
MILNSYVSKSLVWIIFLLPYQIRDGPFAVCSVILDLNLFSTITKKISSAIFPANLFVDPSEQGLYKSLSARKLFSPVQLMSDRSVSWSRDVDLPHSLSTCNGNHVFLKPLAFDGSRFDLLDGVRTPVIQGTPSLFLFLVLASLVDFLVIDQISVSMVH